jgi:tagatose 6-phosphate kinase
MILVVTLNPALDVTHEVAGADWSGVNRPDEVSARPGGKGVNVARALRGLGADVLVTGLAGGPAGDALRAGLAAAGVPADFAVIAGETRRTFAVVDTRRGQTGLFNEPGPPVSAAEYDRFREMYRAALAASAAVVLSGSLPPGLPAGAYAGLARQAAAAGVPVVLDADGAALRLGTAGRPAIVKPNLEELERAAGRPLRLAPAAGDQPTGQEAAGEPAGTRERAGTREPAGTRERAPRPASTARGLAGEADPDAVVQAARELMTAGAGAVVVSLGAAGLLAVTGEGIWQAVPPGPAAGNPTGAGDAAVAGLAQGLVLGRDWPDRLRRAAAMGTAAVAERVAGEVHPDRFRELLPLISVVRRDS